MKRSHQSSDSDSDSDQECPNFSEEKVSSPKKRKFGVAPCTSENPRATKRVSFTKCRACNLLKNAQISVRRINDHIL